MTTTLERFEQWLRAHQPDEVVGIPQQSDACPMTCFKAEVDQCLVETWLPSISPGHDVVEKRGAKLYIPEEPELRQFINDVDDSDAWIKGYVTAGHALAILHQVKA